MKQRVMAMTFKRQEQDMDKGRQCHSNLLLKHVNKEVRWAKMETYKCEFGCSVIGRKQPERLGPQIFIFAVSL